MILELIPLELQLLLLPGVMEMVLSLLLAV